MRSLISTINCRTFSDDYDVYVRLLQFVGTKGRESRNVARRRAQPILNKTDFEGFRSCPSEDRNRRLRPILGALDDKIDLNRRMNETLEAMARAIFKDWFVDFGPTRAKMEGRAPYLAPEIWALFPDRLDDEGKPEGWRCGHYRGRCNSMAMRRASSCMHIEISSFGDIPVLGGAGRTEFRSRDHNVERIIVIYVSVAVGAYWELSSVWHQGHGVGSTAMLSLVSTVASITRAEWYVSLYG